MHHPSFSRALAMSVTALVLLACGDPTSPAGTTEPAVSFSVSTAEQITATGNRAAFAVADAPLVLVQGTDTLRIDSVRVVLAQATLTLTSDQCGVAGHDDTKDAGCANISAGPVIVKLPLTTGVLSLFTAPIPAGSYTRLSVRVHKPTTSGGDSSTIAFLQLHPEWFNKSAMVDGTFNGVAFHWAHDPPIQLNHTFDPPLVITADGSNFTLKIDVASWFRASSGALINPGAPTNALYPQIAGNVANSLKLFRDNGKKGHDDGK